MPTPALAAALPGLHAPLSAASSAVHGAARDLAQGAAPGAFARELQLKQQAQAPVPAKAALTPAAPPVPANGPPPAPPAPSARAAKPAPAPAPANPPDAADPAVDADAAQTAADEINPNAAARRQLAARLRTLRQGAEQPAEQARTKAGAATLQTDDAVTGAENRPRRGPANEADAADPSNLLPVLPGVVAPTPPPPSAAPAAPDTSALATEAMANATSATRVDPASEGVAQDPATTEPASHEDATADTSVALADGATASRSGLLPTANDRRGPMAGAPAPAEAPTVAASGDGAARAIRPLTPSAAPTDTAATDPTLRAPRERARPAEGEPPMQPTADHPRDALALTPITPTPSGPRDDASYEALQTAGQPAEAAASPPAAPAASSFAAELLRAQAAGDPARPHTPAREPTDMQLSTPVTAPDFVPRLSGELAVLARDGVQEARVQVHPVELGPISVQISLDGTAAQVHLAVDSAQTRELLEQAMPALAAAMRENGLTLTGGGVFQQARQQARQDAPGPGDGSRSTGPDGRALGAVAASAPASRATRHAGVVDLYA